MKKLQLTVDAQNERITQLEKTVKNQDEKITRIEKQLKELQADNDELMTHNHGPKCGCFDCERGKALRNC